MAEIRNFGIVRHLRAEPSSHIIKYKKGQVDRSERGVALWFSPMSSSLAEVPVDDRELSFLFHGRTSDFQDVTAVRCPGGEAPTRCQNAEGLLRDPDGVVRIEMLHQVRGYDEVDYVRERVDEKLKAGLERVGFTVLAINEGGFAYLLSRFAIRKVEDLPKAKVWIPEDDILSQITLELAGVSPIPLPIADVYTSLQTGLIDTVAAPPMGAIAFQWHTKVDYLTNVPLMYLTGVLALDTKTFKKLKPADQEIVREEIEVASASLDADARSSDANALEALKKQGVEFVLASSTEELQRWHSISKQAIERLRAMNRYSEANLTKIIGLIEAYRAQNGAGTPAK